jgi:hypothetical protein
MQEPLHLSKLVILTVAVTCWPITQEDRPCNSAAMNVRPQIDLGIDLVVSMKRSVKIFIQPVHSVVSVDSTVLQT